MKVGKATKKYETWLGKCVTLLEDDLKLKHKEMRKAVFPFLRATFYRWAQVWPKECKEVAAAPEVLAVGDLHVENFGTWRDAEGRLVWGINDFDEAWPLPYTSDLVRLATSAHVAIAENHMSLDPKEAADAILEGYKEGLEKGGRPFVLAERQSALRTMVRHRLHDPQQFWQKLDGLTSLKRAIPPSAAKSLARAMPEPNLTERFVHRVAGLGSLGRQRFVVLAEWRGGQIAREAKALAPSACRWAAKGKGAAKILYQEILDRAVRCQDPGVHAGGRWIVRRLAPDCSRVELKELPKEREEIHLLHAMGFETANVHWGSRKARAIRKDLSRRPHGWLQHAAQRMAEVVREDWKQWRAHD